MGSEPPPDADVGSGVFFFSPSSRLLKTPVRHDQHQVCEMLARHTCEWQGSEGTVTMAFA